MNYSSFFGFIFLAACLISCGKNIKDRFEIIENTKTIKLPYFNSALFTPEWEKRTHIIPDFSFTNQKGDTVTNKTFSGTIYIANFFFTICPGICSKLTKNMSMLQEEYKDDTSIKLLSHSVMPWKDTTDKLAVYAKQNGVKLPKWHLVTGDTEIIYNIARNGYFADEDFVKTKDESAFIHTENFVLVDKQGYIRGVYNGTLPLEINRLMQHIKILKNEF